MSIVVDEKHHKVVRVSSFLDRIREPIEFVGLPKDEAQWRSFASWLMGSLEASDSIAEQQLKREEDCV